MLINTKNNGFGFLEFISIKEAEVNFFMPVAGSFAIIKCKGKYLLCYNVWRQQWEFPAGQREGDETPKECAIRELYEETGQVVNDLEFKGLLKVKNTMNETVKFNPVYFAVIENLQPFIENKETKEIKLWDVNEEIDVIDKVDLKIVDYV